MRNKKVKNRALIEEPWQFIIEEYMFFRDFHNLRKEVFSKLSGEFLKEFPKAVPIAIERAEKMREDPSINDVVNLLEPSLVNWAKTKNVELSYWKIPLYPSKT